MSTHALRIRRFVWFFSLLATMLAAMLALPAQARAQSVTQVLFGSSMSSTSGSNLTIGEQVYFRTTVTLPESSTWTNATLAARLPFGVALISVDSVVASSNLTTTLAGGFDEARTGAVVTNNGQTVTLSFGNVQNASASPSPAETITVELTAIVLNQVTTQAGTILLTDAKWTADEGTAMSGTAPATVVEPQVQVSIDSAMLTADAQEPVYFIMSVTAPSGATRSSAYDVTVSNPLLPTGMAYAGGLAHHSGKSPTSLSSAGNTITVTYGSLNPGETGIVTFAAYLTDSLVPGQGATQDPLARWSSFPGSLLTPQSSYNAASTERTGDTADPGGSLNDYRATDSFTLTMGSSSLSGIVYVDADYNGAYGVGEPGIEGSSILLTGWDHLGNPVNRGEVTLADGTYSFGQLRPGTYTLTQTQQPAGFLDGPESSGTPAGTPSGTDAIAINLPSSSQTTGVNYNFGERVRADLSLSMTTSRDSVPQGLPVTYTMTVKNNSSLGPAANLVLTNPLPGGTVYLSHTAPGGWSCTTPGMGNAGTFACSAPSLNPDATATITLTAGLQVNLLRQSIVRNLATITAATADVDTRNNAAAANITVVGPADADLGVTQTVSQHIVSVGDPVTYTITVTNQGLAPSTATVSETLPPNLTLIGIGSSQGSCRADTVSCVTDLAPGASDTITVSAVADSPGATLNTANVTSSAPDVNPANDSAMLAAHVVGATGTVLTLEQTGSVTAAHDSTAEYTIVVRNTGPNAANGVRVTADALPTGVSFVSNTVNCATAFPCDLGTLNPGEVRTIRTTVAIDVSAGSRAISHTANVSSDNGATPHATSTVQTVVGPAGSAELRIIKFDSPYTAVTGSVIRYIAVLTNDGPADATNVAVSETLPAGATALSAETSVGSCSVAANAFNCTIGTLEAGRVVTMSFAIQTSSAQPASNTFPSTSSVSTSTPDPIPANNSVALQTPMVPVADLQINASGPTTITVGESFTTTTVVVNNGPSDAINISVAAAPPSGVSFVSNSGDCATAFPCTFATIPLNESRTITSTWTTPSSYTAPTAVITTTVSADSTDPAGGNNSSTASSTSVIRTDLAMAVSGPASVSASGSASYTLTVTNNGPADATGVQVANPTPSNLTFTSTSGDCTTAFPCTLGAMAVGQTRTIIATFAVPPSYTSPDPIVNAATVSSTTTDPNAGNNSASASTALGSPSAELSVTMTGPATATPGLPVQFTISVHNDGPADAPGVTLTGSIPAGLSFAANAGDCSTAFPCALGTVAVGETKTIQSSFLVPPIYTTPDPIVNTVSISSSAIDTNSANDTATADVSVGADVSLTMTAAPDPVIAGSNLTFTIAATNGGARDAADVTIAGTLPAGTTFVSASVDANGGCDTPAPGATGNVSCTWGGPTAAGATRTLTLTVRVNPDVASGSTVSLITNTISLTNDPNPANNIASASSTVSTVADIVLTKVVNNNTPIVGDEVTFTVAARNDGPSNATGVAVVDALPVGLELITATPSHGTYNAAPGLWIVGSLANGASATLQMQARVTADGALTNTATKTAGDQPDPDGSNNSAAVTLTSNPSADVRVLKTVDVTSANVGDAVTFIITASNAGPNTATGVRIVDALPAGLTFVSATPSSGSFDAATGTWTLDPLAMNAQVTLTLQATIAQSGAIVNEARKTAQDEHDPNPANDVSGATVNGLAADLQVVKTMALQTDPRFGQEVSYSITVTNNGPSAATGIRIREALPPGLGFVAATPSAGVYVPQSGVWEIDTLAATGPGAVANLTIRAVIKTVDAIINRASVLASDQPDPNPNNNTSSVSTTALSSALNGRVEITGDPTLVGGIVEVAVEVKNSGNAPSGPPLTMTVPLPGGYDYVPAAQSRDAEAASAGWTCTLVGRTVFCRLDGALAPGESSVAHLRFQVNQAPPAGSALFAYLTAPGEASTAQNVLQAPLGAPQAAIVDLAVTQEVTVARANLARTLTYAIAVTNHGAAPAENVVLTDALPAGATFVSAVAGEPAAACDRAGSYAACHLGTVQPGQTVPATFVLSATAPGTIAHTLSVGGTQAEATPADNQSALVTALDTTEEPDTDGDGMPDWWESALGLPVLTPSSGDDDDQDGVSNADEYLRGTHPRGTDRRYFAEGATNAFFQTTIAVLNPDPDHTVSVMIELLRDDGTTASTPRMLAPLGRVELDASTLLPGGGAFSVLVESDRPIAVDRDMRWDGTGYGSTGESGSAVASTAWYFAEGATGPYSLFYLIENPSLTESAQVEVTYLLTDGRPPVVTTETVAPHSRLTIPVNGLSDAHPSLRAAEIAATIRSTNQVPIVAERAMYLNLDGQPMGAGHAGLGATAPSTSWFFAEGATGAFFKEYVLLANPQSAPAEATVRYLLPDGTSFEKTYGLKPTSRLTIDVAGEDPRLAATAVAATVTATQPIVAERVMWWPGPSQSPVWYEAHVSLGATQTGEAWAIAGGTSGLTSRDQTYALVANQETRAGQVRVTVSLDSGVTVSETIDLDPTSRTTIDFAARFPETRNAHFSAVIESIGATPVPIVVEWARYSTPGAQFWGAGSAALATKVR